MRLSIAVRVSAEEWNRAVDDYRKYYPNDLGIDFYLMNGHATQKQYEKALECLDRANKQVGGDSMMLYQRSALLLELQRIPEAKSAIEDAIIGEPDLQILYSHALNVSLVEQNFDDTVRYLTILENDSGQQCPDLQEIPTYSEFVKSRQYRNWIEARPKK
jgi:tetratricopeptide (TPR) repeat protein